MAEFEPMSLAEHQKRYPVAPVTRLYPRTREVGLRWRSRFDYRVDLDRAMDPAALLGWIEHLSSKAWIKPQHIRELIRHAEKQNGITINRSV